MPEVWKGKVAEVSLFGIFRRRASNSIDWDAIYARHMMEFVRARQDYYKNSPGASKRIKTPSADEYFPKPSRVADDDGYRTDMDVPGMIATCFSYYY